jgi:hypothetical protein
MSKHSPQQRLQYQKEVTRVYPLRLHVKQVLPLLAACSSQMRVEARAIWRVSPPGEILLCKVVVVAISQDWTQSYQVPPEGKEKWKAASWAGSFPR